MQFHRLFGLAGEEQVARLAAFIIQLFGQREIEVRSVVAVDQRGGDLRGKFRQFRIAYPFDNTHRLLGFGHGRHDLVSSQTVEVGDCPLQQVDTLDGQSGGVATAQDAACRWVEPGF